MNKEEKVLNIFIQENGMVNTEEIMNVMMNVLMGVLVKVDAPLSEVKDLLQLFLMDYDVEVRKKKELDGNCHPPSNMNK